MYCPNCGREYENNQNFCRFCGYKLQGYQPFTAESPSLNTQPMENNNQYQNYQQQPYQEQNAQVAYQQVENQYQQQVENQYQQQVENQYQQVENQYQQVENQYQQTEYQQERPEVQPAVEQENQNVQQEEEQEVEQGFDMSKLTNIKLTTKQKILVAIVAILLACFAGLLWSINVETQIIPSETEYNDNFEMNVPSDDDREYTKAPENPILERGAQVTGTGHNCMFRTTAGELMICYHGRTEATGNDRIAFISPAHFDEQGRLVIDAE